MKLYEEFNQSKLQFLINNCDDYPKVKNKLSLFNYYLNRSRNNKIVSFYKSKSDSRLFVKNFGLQKIPSKIRNTICREYYNDYDIVNSHPVILYYICKKNNIKSDELLNYINNRDKILNSISKDNSISIKDAKKIILSLTNGGTTDFNKLNIKHNELLKFKDEMRYIHCELSLLYTDKFEENKKKRIQNKKNYNHEASLTNILICEIESKILNDIYGLSSPETAF